MPNVATTVSGPIRLGSRWRLTMPRVADARGPATAVTNSASRSESSWPRTMRATCGQPSRPMTAMTDSEAGPDDGHEDDHEQQRRDAQDRVGEAHQDLVHPAAEVAGEQPDRPSRS